MQGNQKPMIESPLIEKALGYIGGQWCGADSGKTTPLLNPATGEHLADVPSMGVPEITAAVEAAESAMAEAPSPGRRARWLTDMGDAMLAHKDELARIITLENGKPLAESAGEVEYGASFFHYFAGQLDHLSAKSLPGSIRNCRWTVHHRPAGVAGFITPWNFPVGMVGKKLPAALGAGCAVVAKPAPQTPLSMIACWALAEQVGIPAGWMNLVIGDAAAIGGVLCAHPAVRVISFTGSTATGTLLIEQTAPYVKRLAMELGGHAPFIVFDDADLERAADELMVNKFRAGGQTCICANRVYAHSDIAVRFVDAVADRVGKLRVGNGLDPQTTLGPLINRAGFDKVARHVRDALENGAKRIVGDDPPRPGHDWGAFYSPTVLLGVKSDMAICREETFGPVVGVSEFDDEQQVVDQANSTPYGLAAFLFTADVERAERIGAALKFGHVGINTGTNPTPQAPFGGMKQSGFGREGGLEGLLEFSEPQVLVRG